MTWRPEPSRLLPAGGYISRRPLLPPIAACPALTTAELHDDLCTRVAVQIDHCFHPAVGGAPMSVLDEARATPTNPVVRWPAVMALVHLARHDPHFSISPALTIAGMRAWAQSHPPFLQRLHELQLSGRRAHSRAVGVDDRPVRQYANGGLYTLLMSRWVEHSLPRGVDGPQRISLQLEVPKKGCHPGDCLLHKINRPIHIAPGHTRLHSGAIGHAISARMELCFRWPAEFFAGRPEMTALQASFGARAAITLQLYQTCCTCRTGRCRRRRRLY